MWYVVTPLQTVCAQFRADKTSGMIWIQTDDTPIVFMEDRFRVLIPF